MRYPLVFYVDNLPADVGGCTNGPIIRILKKYRDDEGLYQHELEHVKQGATLLFIGHALLYLFSRRYRQWAEVQAYAKQTNYPDGSGGYLSANDAAWRICRPKADYAHKYDLRISMELAVAALIRAGARW